MPFCNQTAEEVLPTAVFKATQVLNPILLLVVFILSTAVHGIITSKNEEEIIVPTARGPGGKPLPITKRKKFHKEPEPTEFSNLARRTFLAVSVLLTFSFIANGVAASLHALWEREKTQDFKQGWWCGEAAVVYIIGSTFIYLYFVITLLDWSQSPIVVHFFVWVLGLLLEVILLVSFALKVSHPHWIMHEKTCQLYEKPSMWDLVDLGIGAVRVALLLGLVLLYASNEASAWRQRFLPSAMDTDDEEAPLLQDAEIPGYQSITSNTHSGQNGSLEPRANGNAKKRANTTNGNAESSAAMPDAEAAFYRPEKLPHKTWFEYLRGYTIFFPYLWPKDSLKLQGIVLVCFLLLTGQRIVNVLVPYQIGAVTNALSNGDSMPWRQLSYLIVYKLLQGSSGFLGSLRGLLWIPVSQYCYRSLTSAAFEHVHSLSLDFHLGKRTGEVLSALNKGASINAFMEQVTFQVFPMLFDLFFAISFFYFSYDATYAVIVGVITFYYLFLTIRMAQTRADQRRDMVNADREEEAVKNDSITSYETVKYFNAEAFEFKRYRGAVKEFQKAEAQVTLGQNIMNICQSLVFMCGLLVAMMLGAYQVSYGYRDVGSFVTLMTYLNQLQGPLNFFGTFYRTVQSAMISGERLLELFKIQPSVVDPPGVPDLQNCQGHIKWTDVEFAYDQRRPALHDLTFECKPGTTTAFVGESGGGKSTVFRLMYRYYNCQDGSISIDGHDVKNVSIDSVRKYIGVVPQDTILFNETLMFNLRYANQDASDEDIYNACRAASIHDRILSFPDGYDTKVGERGLRLSGGEKQRVAIARTILKNPKIIMLDEATSALDTHTEQQIQGRLSSIGEGRTLLIIAHRLSTITHADQILVLDQGTIIERGTHDELLAQKGHYASMWDKQIRAEEAEVEAYHARQHAKLLLRQAGIGGAESDSSSIEQTDGEDKHKDTITNES